MFGGNGMDKNIKTYINQIVSGLACNEKEKEEIVDEMTDHLYLLKREYLEQGFSEEEAAQKALESFGEQKQIKRGYQESLFPYYKIFKIGSWIIFCLYSLILLWKLLLQRGLERLINYSNGYGFATNGNGYFFYPENSSGFIDIETWQLNSNLIPFKNIMVYINGYDRFNLDIIINNTLGNVLIFLPLGLFLPILFKKYTRFSKLFFCSILISFTIEALQFILQIGQFDIDDIILNTSGSIVGYFIIKTIYEFRDLIKEKSLQKTTS